MNKSTSELSKSEELTSRSKMKQQSSASMDQLTLEPIPPEPSSNGLPPFTQRETLSDSIVVKRRAKRSPVQKLVSLFRKKKRRGHTNGFDDTTDKTHESSPTLDDRGRTSSLNIGQREKIPFSRRKLSEHEINKYPNSKIEEKSKSTSGISLIEREYESEKYVQNGLRPKRPGAEKLHWSSGSSASSTEEIKIPDITQMEQEIKNPSGSKRQSPTLQKMVKTPDAGKTHANGVLKTDARIPSSDSPNKVTNDSAQKRLTPGKAVPQKIDSSAKNYPLSKKCNNAGTKVKKFEETATDAKIETHSKPISQPAIQRHFIKKMNKPGEIMQTSFLDQTAQKSSSSPLHMKHNRTPSTQFKVSEFDGNTLNRNRTQKNVENQNSTVYTSEHTISPTSSYKTFAEINITPRANLQGQNEDTTRISPTRTASKHEKYKAFEPNKNSSFCKDIRTRSQTLDGLGHSIKMSPSERSLSPNSDSDRLYFSSSPDFDSDSPVRCLSPGIGLKTTVSRHLSLDGIVKSPEPIDSNTKRTPDYSTKWKFMQTDLDEITQSNRKYRKGPPSSPSSTVTYKIDAEILESWNSSTAEKRKPMRKESLNLDGKERSISPFLRGYRIGEQARNVSLSSILKRTDLTLRADTGIRSKESLSKSVPENINRRDPSLLRNIILKDKNGGSSGAQDDDIKIPYYINPSTEPKINPKKSQSPKKPKSFLPLNTGLQFSTPQEMAEHAAILAEQLTQQSRILSEDLTAMVNENQVLTKSDVSRLIRPSEVSILQSVKKLQALLADDYLELSSPSLIRSVSEGSDNFKYPDNGEIGKENRIGSSEVMEFSEIDSEVKDAIHVEAGLESLNSTCPGHGARQSVQNE